MAQLTQLANGTRRVQWTSPIDGARRTLRLGKVSKRDAETVRGHVANLLSAQCLGVGVDASTSAWLSRVSDALKIRLARCHLITGVEIPPRTVRKTLKDFFDAYIEQRRSAVKPATVLVWKTASKSFMDAVGTDLRIDELRASHATTWIDAMRSANLSPATQHKRLTFVKQFLDHAVADERLSKNPFSDVKLSRPSGKSNVEVTRQTIYGLIQHLPPKWQAIIALCRFGGLRCPSEVLSLEWSGIDFNAGTMQIHEPKNERQHGRGKRLCPLFPELRPYLEALPSREGYVIDDAKMRAVSNTPTGWANVNLSTALKRYLKQADIKPWPRLFHSLRASRQTELERDFGLTAACAWLGNTESVAKQSYLLVTSDLWASASGQVDVKRDAKRDVSNVINGRQGRVRQ
jgi:integrase